MASEQYGAINISTANAIGAMLNKKMGVQTGFAPKDWPETSNLLVKLPTKTVSGSVASFSDGAGDVPLKSWEVTIASTLDGVSSVDVVHGVKNFIDDNLSNLEQGTIESDHGTNLASNTRVRNANYTPFPYDDIYSNYKLTIPNGWKFAIRFYKSDNTYVTLPSWAVGFVTNLPYDLVGQGVTKARFVFAKTDNSAITPEDVKNVGFQIEVGSTATAYTPYVTPTTHTVNLGRTIYGGTVDVVNGTGTDGYSGLIALNSKQWNKTTVSGHTAFYCSFSDGYLGTGADNFDGACSSYDVTTDTTLANDKVIRFYYNSSYNFSRAVIRDDQYANLTGAEFQEVVTGNMVYRLNEASETPFTFTATPINSLYGVNNVWNNVGGNTEVTYRRDCDLALQESEA